MESNVTTLMNNQQQHRHQTSSAHQRQPLQHFSPNKENDMTSLMSQNTETNMKSALDQSPDINSADISNDHIKMEDTEDGNIKRPTIKKRKYSKFGCKECKRRKIKVSFTFCFLFSVLLILFFAIYILTDFQIFDVYPFDYFFFFCFSKV